MKKFLALFSVDYDIRRNSQMNNLVDYVLDQMCPYETVKRPKLGNVIVIETDTKEHAEDILEQIKQRFVDEGLGWDVIIDRKVLEIYK